MDRLAQVMQRISDFATAREWDQFHTPKNLVAAICSEVGELSGLVRWIGDRDIRILALSKPNIKKEIGDVLNFTLRLCQVLDLDPIEILNEGIDINEKNYPVELSRGNAKKYNELG